LKEKGNTKGLSESQFLALFNKKVKLRVREEKEIVATGSFYS